MKTKLFITLLWWALVATPVFSQPQGCDSFQATPQQAEYLDYRLLMHRDGNLWVFYREDIEDGFSGVGGLWTSAHTPDGTLRVAVSQFGWYNSFTGDFWPGPLKDNGDPNPGWCPLFDRIWKISREQVEAFIADWEDNQQLDNPLPEVIASWPGSGNLYYLENYLVPLPIDDLAPFFDRNGNHIYEPLLGDYPLIKGDNALWKMINDNGGPHSESYAAPLKIQARIMAYTFDINDPLFPEPVFYEVSIKNKNPEPIQGFKTGIWMYNDWACPSWQRWTVQAGKNLACFFNLYYPGDSCTTVPSPAFIEEWNYWHGLKLLRSPVEKDSVYHSQLSGVTYYRSNGNINPPPGTTDPNIDIEYHRYLTNHWRDGSPFTYGGDGYQTGEPYPFVFPDPLIDSLGWSACTTEWPNYWLYSLVNIPLGDFAPGEKKSFDLAFFRIPAPQPMCTEPGWLAWPGDLLQLFWENEVVAAVSEAPVTVPEVRIIPNPAFGEFTIHALDLLTWKVWNLQGMEMAEGNEPQAATIRTDGWPEGMYFVEVLWEDGGRRIGKVVVK